MSNGFLKETWLLIKPYFTSSQNKKGLFISISVVSLELLFVALDVCFNFWMNAFYNSLQKLDYKEFIYLIFIYFGLVAFISLVFVLKTYLSQILQLYWRTWMTNSFLQSYLSNKSYYFMRLKGDAVDNPGQRIAEDVNNFTQQTIELCLGMLNAASTLIAYFVLLWNLSGSLVIPLGGHTLTISGYLLWASLAYALLGIVITLKMGKPLIPLNYHRERFEANFRYALDRVQENVEAVAFYRNESKEELHLRGLFTTVIGNFQRIIACMFPMNLFTRSYDKVSMVIPSIAAAPQFFSGKIQLGGLMQIIDAFEMSQQSLFYIINNYPQIAKWQATAHRLINFKDSILSSLPLQNSLLFMEGEGRDIIIENFTLCLPNGEKLFENMNLTLRKGNSLLILGPSGSGKSTLLRTLAGLWPFGEGKIIHPKNVLTAFLPQKPYMPLGTLYNSICCFSKEKPSLDEVKQRMFQCGLAHLIEQLEEENDWARILSLGMQQRIGFVRILLQMPDWIFLDESTSSLEESAEAELYTLIAKEVSQATLISVGHRSTLQRFHQNKFILHKNRHKKISIMVPKNWTGKRIGMRYNSLA